MSWLDDVFGSSPSQGPGNPLGEPDADRRMREHDEALAQLRADRKLNQLLARQEAERASAFFDPPRSIAPDPLWPGVHSEPFVPLNYLSAPFNPPNDTGFDPSDDWQKRGRDTAAMALSILYPQDGPIPVAASQPPNAG